MSTAMGILGVVGVLIVAAVLFVKIARGAIADAERIVSSDEP